jgi:hypothetical protein
MKWWMVLLVLLAMPATASAQESDSDTEESSDEESKAKGEKPGAKGEKPAAKGEKPAANAETAPEPKGPKGEKPAPEPAPEPEPAAAPEPAATPQAFAPEPEPSKWDLLLQAPAPPLRIDLPHGLWLIPEADLQVWATIVDMDDDARNNPVVVGDPDHRSGFSIRRARFGLGAGLGSLAKMRITAGWQDRYDALEIRPTGPELVEASFSFTPFHFIGLTAGYTRMPFGRQEANSSMDLAFFERSMMAEQMSPAREPGVVIGGSIGPKGSAVMPEEAFTYEIGLSNGHSDFTGDLDPEPRISARLQVNLFDKWTERESRFPSASPGALSIGGGVTHNRALQANTTTIGADLGVQVWRVKLQGEFAWSKAEPTFDIEGIPELLATRVSMGWYAQVVFAVVPDWFEVAVRVDGYDDNLALDDAGNRLDVTGGVNLLVLKGRLKVQLDYIHREELVDAAKTANDSLIMVLQARL